MLVVMKSSDIIKHLVTGAGAVIAESGNLVLNEGSKIIGKVSRTKIDQLKRKRLIIWNENRWVPTQRAFTEYFASVNR